MNKKMWVFVVVAAVLFVSLPKSVWADDSRVLAEKLLNIKHMPEVMKNAIADTRHMMKQMMASQIKNFGGNIPASAADAQEKMMDKMMDLVTNEMSWDKIKDDYISMYAEIYTEEELKALIDFYKSPIGQSVADKEPELLEKTMEMQQKRMMQLMPKIQELIGESMKESMKKSPPNAHATPPASVPATPPAQP